MQERMSLLNTPVSRPLYVKKCSKTDCIVVPVCRIVRLCGKTEAGSWCERCTTDEVVSTLCSFFFLFPLSNTIYINFSENDCVDVVLTRQERTKGRR